MAKKTIKARVDNLEAGGGDKPFIAVFQNWDDPDLYHVGARENEELLTWDEIEARYSDHVICRVIHVDDWRGDNENGV